MEAVDDDNVVINQFSPQECVPGPVEVLTEMKNMPVCVTKTKQQCDSKWEINSSGEKVFVSNDNCHDVTWEDCTLELQPVTTEVPTWTCATASPLLYQSVQHQPAEVTLINRVCTAKAEPVCQVTQVQQCKEVEWEDCFDAVSPHCFYTLYKIPHQHFNHVLRCAVDH